MLIIYLIPFFYVLLSLLIQNEVDNKVSVPP